MAFFNIIFALGLETAFMRYVEGKSGDERKDIFSAPFLLITASAILFSCIIHSFTPEIVVELDIRPEWHSIVPLAAWTLAIDAFNVIPFASLRMQNKAKRFAFIKSVSITANVLLNVFFIAGLRMSIIAIFIAGILSAALTTILLIPTIASQLRFALHPKILRSLLRYGIPTIPFGLAAMTVQVADRIIMQRMVASSTVGIYQANYKLGIFMMLIVSMFQYAWQPFYLQTAAQPDAKRIFSRVMTYFTLVGVAVILIVSFFIDDAVHLHLIGEKYWSGVGIVPIILFSYLFTGIAAIFNAGLFIEKRTSLLPAITGVGAAVNVGMNIFLIPSFGIFGAAFATLGAYVSMAVLSWVFTRRIYPVAYEYGRLLKIVIAAGVPACVWYLQVKPSPLHQIVWEVFLVVFFVFLLFGLRFFSRNEIKEMKRLFPRIVPR